MLNKYPLWKNALIILILLIGGIYAAPNLYPDDYAVQLSGTRESNIVSQPLLDRVKQSLTQAQISFKEDELTDKGGLIRFPDSRTQLEAKEVISRTLGDDYVVALNLAPTTPEWLRSVGAGPMKLGLDLRGGVHFLLEVDMVSAVTSRLDVYVSEIKTKLRTEKLRYRAVNHREDGSLELKFSTTEVRDEAMSLLRKDYTEFLIDSEDREQAFYLTINLAESKISEIEDYAIKQNLTTLRNRVNELGVAEPLVQRQGRNRIVVQLPGIQDAAAAKRIIGKTANLEFRLE
ncbi:MAG: protein translocase subunit SecD, partial [Amphritea sp.]|nr:protein translocase subunit SecD [Amphritea sp.]